MSMSQCPGPLDREAGDRHGDHAGELTWTKEEQEEGERRFTDDSTVVWLENRGVNGGWGWVRSRKDWRRNVMGCRRGW